MRHLLYLFRKVKGGNAFSSLFSMFYPIKRKGFLYAGNKINPYLRGR